MENHDEAEYTCRICGYIDDGPRWANGTPDNDICSACGSEFGLHDTLLQGVRELRGYRVGQGEPWSDPECKPEGWDLLRQLAKPPAE
ncbi:hypothetical protein [Streptomyces pinistramenti]|uniref:hypothetical protein n=1 Tax=Streptomyces pinistramenti TaxID=2884812 RepID=UPI001D072B7A|nr:hypothetical protein [Streptomyces pinistramenti]MCB5912165.1 hypothetical protein [Streptomyces pinistramenti]